MKKFFEDFKAFAMRGNVIDMAVGVIIGAAFGSITTSLVNDIFMPLIGVLTGGINFGGLFVALDGGSYVSAEAAAAAGVGTINYGLFIQNVINFKKFGYDTSKGVLIISVLITLFGVLVMMNPFSTAKVLFFMLGLGLFVSGLADFVSDMIFSRQLKKIQKAKDEAEAQL